MVKLPKSVKVGPYRFNFEKQVDPVNSRGEAVWGLTKFTDQKIVLDADLCLDRERAVVFHELLHACWDTSGLNGKKYTEEQVILALTPVLLETIRTNKKLMEYLNND